jgi:Domain of unknown function (DUF4412)
MKAKQFFSLVTLAAISVTSASFGQGMFGARSKDPGQQLAKFFGKNTAFTATAHVTMADSAGKQLHEMEFHYAMLDGKVRTEMDMTKVQGANLPPKAMAQMKQMGMDRMVHIFLPDKNVAYMLYPSMKAYCEMNTAQTTGQKESKAPKIEETELGKDTIDGHPCLKSKVVVTDEDGRKFEAVVWKATDLKDFPIQTQMTNDDQTTTTKFTDINRSKPSASMFEPPSDFKRYASMQELMMSNMQQMMPQGGMPPRSGASE